MKAPWKIERDPFYAPLMKPLGGLSGIEEAGFFWDTALSNEPLDDVRWLCSPLEHPTRHLKQGVTNPIILLCTGAFCPPHRGHLNMMEVARQAAIAHGFDVIGGYLSPGHDEYIRLKIQDQAISASKRIHWCAQATAKSNWLSVDPWEALYRPCAVNFTDVITRLENYVEHHLGHRIPVAYVCGSDNARFALTFIQKGHCIVVHRPGYETQRQTYQNHPLIKHNPRVLWTEHDDDSSSTKVRAGAIERLPSVLQNQPQQRIANITLRQEPIDVTSHFGLSQDQWSDYLKDIKGIFESFGFTTQTSTHDHQKEAVQNAQSNTPWISLDPLLPTQFNLKISRCFELGGYTQRDHVPRPMAPDFKTQLSNIPNGTYHLFDDDSVTGTTLKWAEALLAPRCIAQHHTATQLTSAHPDVTEVADSRDFLPGTFEGGLVIKIGDQYVRAPYMLPYVDPHARCNILPQDSMKLSAILWTRAAQLFEQTQLTVCSLPIPSKRLMHRAGFLDQDTLFEVCQWHQKRLQHDMNQSVSTEY